MTRTTRSEQETLSRGSAWSAVFALTLCVGTLIASEFMPVSLLTPIAAGLRMTEGQAGQAIAVSGVFAVLDQPRHLLGDAWHRSPHPAVGLHLIDDRLGADGRTGAERRWCSWQAAR